MNRRLVRTIGRLSFQTGRPAATLRSFLSFKAHLSIQPRPLPRSLKRVLIHIDFGKRSLSEHSIRRDSLDAMATDTTRTYATESGPVVGEVRSDLVFTHGIPFAKVKRFAAPEKAESWTEPRDCTKLGPLCPQLPFRLEFVLGDRPKNREFDEDCLNLTVIAPASSSKDDKLPVIVWYHGGANIAGGADLDLMDSRDLARRGVITVSVQYRLGILGCLEIDGLIPPNLHVLDQIASLQWVHDNIANFGGDPDQVTIMGQSAGGAAVYNVIVADNTSHLYKRAIIQSAPMGILHKSGKDAELTANRTKELLGGTPQAVSTKTVDEILEVQNTIIAEQKARGGTIGFWPTWGKYPVPTESEIEKRIPEIAKSKELLIGWTADDAMPFVKLSPYYGLFSWMPLLSGPITLAADKIATNAVFAKGSENFHKKWVKAGGKSTTFSLDWFPEGSELRACHCIDMPFLFGDWDTWKTAPMMHGPGAEEVVKRVAPEVRDVFVHFVKKGLKGGKHMSITEKFTKGEWVKEE